MVRRWPKTAGHVEQDSPLANPTHAVRPASGEAPVGVLIVEDFKPFQVLVSSLLQNKPKLKVIAVVSDGLEAVQKAKELHPKLILLDIGLPKLNGMAAARQIREASPDSKILFLSQETSPEVVQEAISLGAVGYVAKAKAGTELLKAIEVVLSGKRFISSGAVGKNGRDRGTETG
jgi:DNA-binding NarL/FixJ family response regulator